MIFQQHIYGNLKPSKVFLAILLLFSVSFGMAGIFIPVIPDSTYAARDRRELASLEVTSTNKHMLQPANGSL